MDLSTIWWAAAGLAVLAELLSGTFYLLMLALGLCAGALSAHVGASLQVQLVAAALVGGGAVLAWHRRQAFDGHAKAEGALLDVGETVMVAAWQSDGTAEVRYRGAPWTAILTPGSIPQPGLHRVAGMVGNRLLLEHSATPP